MSRAAEHRPRGSPLCEGSEDLDQRTETSSDTADSCLPMLAWPNGPDQLTPYWSELLRSYR
ncbi:hypothetical protein ADK57_09100 [Streptomyces sp. MMG1533]|uniref:hypothetical protein n=1 Tax=Streptomyces sp. MMG1533 TaxID=1415546 RepID=UPI0006ADFE13|nr:hypothetical protein [Streptomyces sp. MMG1533]KOU73263.1 hypothetical protein ADK57_09100 [Streptomyces sp. MMG1533]